MGQRHKILSSPFSWETTTHRWVIIPTVCGQCGGPIFKGQMSLKMGQ